MSAWRVIGWVCLSAVLAGCEGTVVLSGSDAAGSADASGTLRDAGVEDAGPLPDAEGAGPDAAVTDVGSTDAGSPTDAGPSDTGPEPRTDWASADLPFRQVITLQPHATRARTDLPVIAPLEHAGAFVLRSVSVLEVTDPTNPVPVTASLWTSPDGRTAQVGFTAAGTTPATETRRFAVYYRTAATPAAWTWNDGWATRDVLPGGRVGVSGGCCSLVREVDEAAHTLRSGRRAGQPTGLTLLSGPWKVAEGFTNAYQLESGTTTYPTRTAESAPYSALSYDADAAQAAFAATWTVAAPVAHDLLLTQRVFKGWPFAQYQLEVRSAVTPLSLSSNAYSNRSVYLVDAFDRMRADVFGDAPLQSKWDTGMRWFVVWDEATNHGFGWFASARGVLRGEPQTGKTHVFDSYGYTAAGGLGTSALWMASPNKDTILDLFDAMLPGVEAAAPESRDLNVLAPRDGDYAFPDDTLRVRASTPGSTAPVTGTWTLPDKSTLPVDLARVGDTWVWEAASPLRLTASHPAGEWTLTVRSGTQTREVKVQVRHPVHPRLLFSAADLAALRARRTGTHAAIWADLLATVAKYGAPLDDPGPGNDIRGYADRLLNLALVQLLDPAQPYEPRLREYLFKMLRYPHWTSVDRPFNNTDLTIGHFLAALAITYDWHYDRLSADERAELRARLVQMNGTWWTKGWGRYRPATDWGSFGSVTNNHHWIMSEGIAAGAFVLQDEMAEAPRKVWVDRLEANLQVILTVLGTDGSSNEGVSYHSYGQINLFPWLDMRDRALGGDTARSTPWFARSVLWQLHSIAPGGDDNYGGPANFGDCPPYHYNPPRTIQSWLAARLRNGTAQWMAEQLQTVSAPVAYTYLWYDPTVVATPPDTLPTWDLADERGIFAWRSAWANDATYFALKSGSYFGAHEHPDAGHFLLHRAGVPYIAGLGYSYAKETGEHNVVLADGQEQYGAVHQFMAAVDPVHWAGVPEVLADGAYFDLLVDPTKMSQSADLQSWRREVVGLRPGLFFVRDELQAGRAIPFTWLLHGYQTNPPTSQAASYDVKARRLENPFVDLGGARWALRPQAGAPDLNLADLSADAWTPVIEPTVFVPEQNLVTGGYNEALERFQQGFRLRRTRTAAATTSLVAAWFGDGLTAAPLASAQGDGARLYDAGGDLALLVWPKAGATATLSGLTVSGAMGGRRWDAPAYFGREVTSLDLSGVKLVQATPAASVFARLEHLAGTTDPRYAIVKATAPTQLVLRSPQAPTQVLLDGVSVAVAWATGQLTIGVPAGTHRVELRD